MNKVITRKDAKAQGIEFYYNGEPCLNKKKAKRRTSNGDCLCIKCKAIRAAQRRDYYARLKAEGAV